MASDNAGNKGSRWRVRSGQWSRRSLMRAGSVATLAACLYVVVWSALLGGLADNLTTRQEVATATVAALSGGLIWVAVRALVLEQRLLVRQENLEALEESRSFARVLVDNLPAAIWLKNRDHRYMAGNLMWAEFNPAGPDWTGKTSEDLMGHTDRELYEHARAVEFERTDDVVIASGQRWEHQYDEDEADKRRTFRVVKIPVFDAWGSVVSVAGIGVDVTGQRKAEEELEMTRDRVVSFMNRSLEHACVLSVDRTIQFANVRMCEFLGAYPSELLGKDVADYITPSDRERFVVFFEHITTDGSAGYLGIHIPNAAGTGRVLELSGVLVGTTKGPPAVVILGREAATRD
jgi:PAS domain S-box-containing protein